MAKLILYNPLAKVAGKKEFNYDAKTVKEALEMLVRENPILEGRLFMKGELNKFINIRKIVYERRAKQIHKYLC